MRNLNNEKINDFRPEIKSLLNRLIAAKFTLVEGDNGEDKFKFDGDLDKFISNLDATDESYLYVRPYVGITVPENAPANTLGIFLVLGNEPGVIASDYTDHPGLSEVIDAHYEEWNDKPQPTTTRGEKYGVQK